MIDFRTYFDSHTHALPLALPLFLLFSMLQFSVYSLVSWSVNGSFFVHSFEKSHLIVNTGVFLIVFKTHLALLFTVSIKIYSKVQFFFCFRIFCVAYAMIGVAKRFYGTDTRQFKFELLFRCFFNASILFQMIFVSVVFEYKYIHTHTWQCNNWWFFWYEIVFYFVGACVCAGEIERMWRHFHILNGRKISLSLSRVFTLDRSLASDFGKRPMNNRWDTSRCF